MSTPGSAPATPASRDDWATQAADTIDRVVTGLGDKTTRPLTAIARAIVFGIVAAAAGLTLFILVAIAAGRAINVYLGNWIEPYARAVWVSDAIVGGIFTLLGLLVWRTRRPKHK
jgi:hypothetical protein